MEELITYFGERIVHDKDLTHLNTLKLPATAKFFLLATSYHDIQKALEIASKEHLSVFFLGGGTNIAITKHTIPGLTIRNAVVQLSLQRLSDRAYVTVSGGYPMALLAKKTVEAGLFGLHYHIGLPGTVGGGVAMNSKWSNPLVYIGDYVHSATLITPDGKEKKVLKEYFNFAYDYSVLKDTKEILVEVTFDLPLGDKTILIEEAKRLQEYRTRTQPQGKQSGGCFFQNISEEEQKKHDLPTRSAGYLIDKSGLKGYIHGGFRVSDVHANFVEHMGNGTAHGLGELIHHIQKTVKERQGIDLVPEVIVL